MELVQLKDGNIEIIGKHRDLVDIVRDKCGDDVAKMVEENDPADWEKVIEAEILVSSIEDILVNKDECGLLDSNQVSQIEDKIDRIMDLLLEVL